MHNKKGRFFFLFKVDPRAFHESKKNFGEKSTSLMHYSTLEATSHLHFTAEFSPFMCNRERLNCVFSLKILLFFFHLFKKRSKKNFPRQKAFIKMLYKGRPKPYCCWSNPDVADRDVI